MSEKSEPNEDNPKERKIDIYDYAWRSDEVKKFFIAFLSNFDVFFQILSNFIENLSNFVAKVFIKRNFRRTFKNDPKFSTNPKTKL